jgi:hypothetical protein
MAIESGCRLLARCSLTAVLYFLLISFRFNFFSCGVIYSFLTAFFAAYNSRRLLFICAFCSGDIAGLRALSSSRYTLLDTWQYYRWNWMHLQHLYVIRKSMVSTSHHWRTHNNSNSMIINLHYSVRYISVQTPFVIKNKDTIL